MPIPAVLWGLSSGRGIWYPVNLLAGDGPAGHGRAPGGRAGRVPRRTGWPSALAIHAAMSLGFGLDLRPAPAPAPADPRALAWGGLLMPLLWTAVSYGLMGVVNPLLQERVDWPWFIVSQFVFGVAAAIVVDRSETDLHPARGPGPGPARPSSWSGRPGVGRDASDDARPARRSDPPGRRWRPAARRRASPTAEDRPVRSDQVIDFATLYGRNCAGCHGADGKFGPAPPLNDPLFLAIVPDAVLLA